MFESISKKFPKLEFAKILSNKNSIPVEYVSYNYPVAFYIKPGYQPQTIDINLEKPAKTLEQIGAFHQSSKKEL